MLKIRTLNNLTMLDTMVMVLCGSVMGDLIWISSTKFGLCFEFFFVDIFSDDAKYSLVFVTKPASLP